MDEQSDHDLLIELNVKVDTVLLQMREYGSRLTVLEEWRWKWAGAVGLAVLVLSIAGNLFAKALWP